MTEHGSRKLCKELPEMNTTFFALRSSRRTAVLKMKIDSSVCIVLLLVILTISKYTISMYVSMIFVGCSLEKLIPNTVPREK